MENRIRSFIGSRTRRHRTAARHRYESLKTTLRDLRHDGQMAKLIYQALPLHLLESRLQGGKSVVYCDDPLILHMDDWVLERVNGTLLPVFHRYRHRPVYLLVRLTWNRAKKWNIERTARWHRKHQRRHPHHVVIYLANTEAEHEALSRAGLNVTFFNHNAVSNPEIFRPLPTSKRFDAIYDARVCAFKRHHLATEVESLALLGTLNPSYHDQAYVKEIRELLADAHWYNDPSTSNYHRLSLPEVNACLNECRVGLCLSAEEGAMFASIQYLLAGLPIVSTESMGGRDLFFDPEYVRIVEDHPEAVAAGVRAMRECTVSAAEIRERTLKRIEPHKQRLFDLLEGILRAEKRAADLCPRWETWLEPTQSPATTPAMLFEQIKQFGEPSDGK